MKKRVWAWLMTLIMIVTMVPASAFAADEPADASPYTVTNQDAIQPDQTGGVYLNKQLELDSNGEGYITLETYVEGKVKTSSKAVDFIMVLDMSTSMGDIFSRQQTIYTEIYSLDKNKSYYVRTDYGYTKVEWCDNCNAWTDGCWEVFSYHSSGDKYTPRTAAGQPGTQFYTAETVASMTRLDALKSAATNFIGKVAADSGDHRIALVGFEKDASILTGDSVESAFKDASGNEIGLQDIIDNIGNSALKPATEHGKGLKLAESILEADTSTDRERVVILFTDGEPEPYNSGDWSSDIVSGAVNSAYNLKNKHNASVYCISVLPGAASAGTSNMDQYMNYVSSNYKKAKYDGEYSGKNKNDIIKAITTGDGTYGGKYYQVASEMAKLEEIFGSISSDVQKIELDEETIVTDVMSEYFTVNGAAGDVQLYVSPYTGEDSDGAAQFGERAAAKGVTASIENGVVSVSGFDFEPVMNNDDGTAKSGKLLTIVVPVKLNAEATEGMSGETVPSNNTEEAKASIINDDATVAEFAIPAVTLPKEKIVITANSDTKVYDGTALKNAGYTYTEGVLADGDVLTAVVEGSQTDAGESANVVASYKVMRGDVDVTDKYDITTVKGTLKVTPRSVTLTSATDSKVYDGKALTNDEITVGGDGFAEGEGASYGVTGSQLDIGESENAFTYTLNEGTSASNYKITTVEGKLTVTKIEKEIIITANSNTKMYDGEALTDAGYTYTEGILAEGDVLTAVVEGSQTNAGESANVVASYKVMRGNVDVTGNYTFGKSVDGTLKVTPRSVTLTSATDSKEYDGTALTNHEITVGGDGFAEGEGASYDVTGSQLDIGESENAFTYTLNEGTSASNYEITTVEGKLTVTKIEKEIIITANSNTKMYDGEALTDDGYTFTEDVLKNGDVLTAVVKGSQTDAGTCANVIKSVTIMRDGKDVTENYTIATADGSLTVTKRAVTLTSGSAEKEYDGTALTNDKITVSGEGFVEGEGASYDVTGSQLDIGESENTFTYTLNEGTKAENYVITVTEGTLTVVPVKTELIIQADSSTKMYDGTALTDDGYTFTEDVLVEGDVLTAVVEGSQTNVGEAVNEVTSYKVMRDDVDVTDNYMIATAGGKLTVTPRVIALTSASDTKFYDGTPLTNDEITVSGDGFAEGEGLVFTVAGAVTNVAEGVVENKFTYEAAEGTALANYEIETAFGTLEIAPATLIVTADNKTKTQGEENPELTGTITGFVNEETAETALTGTADYTTTADKDSPVGEYPIKAAQGSLEAVNGNYVFEYVDGTLTVVAPPADNSTQTGDDFNPWAYGGIALMAMITAIAAYARRKRQ